MSKRPPLYIAGDPGVQNIEHISQIGGKGVKVPFSINTAHVHELNGFKKNQRHMKKYQKNLGLDRMHTYLGPKNSGRPDLAIQRLDRVIQTEAYMTGVYADGPSRGDAFKSHVKEEQASHYIGKLISNLGDVSSLQSLDKIKNPGRAERLIRKEAKAANPHLKWMSEFNVIYGIGFLDCIYQKGIRGAKMSLKKIVKTLKDYALVSEVVEVDESRTSQECHQCFMNGTPTILDQDDKHWRRKTCPRCHKVWNRDVNAALNILHLLICLKKGEPRPENFIRGFRGHAPTPSPTRIQLKRRARKKAYKEKKLASRSQEGN